jgi:ElaB/YqjD/DUF883 family membrane-anchored ribosome-binding protein
MPDTGISPGQTGDTTAGQAKDKAQQVAGQAQDKVQDARQQARHRMRDQVDQRSTQAGEQVCSTAGDVRSVATELRNQGKDAPARYAEQAADRVERAGDWLRQSDGDAILRDAEDFARRNTWAVVAGGIALGFVASRMLKASSGERYRATQASNGGTLGSNGGGTYPAASGVAQGPLPAEPMPSGVPATGDRFTRDAPAVPDPAVDRR